MLMKQGQRLLGLFAAFFLCSFAAQAQSVNALFQDHKDPSAGNPKGSVTVVEFFDYDCGHCIAMAPVIDAIIRNNPGVRVVFKELPIRGPMSEFAARAALAAKLQGKYYAFNHALLVASRPLSPDAVMQIAKSVGLDTSALKRNMNSLAVRSQINANHALAASLDVNGTPAFFIGKTNAKDSHQVKAVLGEMSRSELQEAINSVK
jgi:protein-disulfide isomerase